MPVSEGKRDRTDSSVAMDVLRREHHSAADWREVVLVARARLREVASEVNWDEETSVTPMSKPGTGNLHSG